MAPRLLYGLALAAGLVSAAEVQSTSVPGPAEEAAAAAMRTSLLERPGAALRRALEELAAGEVEGADALLEALAERHPVIADHARLIQMRWRVESGRHEQAIAMRDRWSDAASPLEAEFLTLLGRAHAARGAEQAARAAWDLALGLGGDAEQRAGLYLAIGDSYQRTGAVEAATEAYLRVWRTHPLSEAAGAAGERLDAIERRLGHGVREPVHHRQRGDAFFRRRRNDEALAAYELALSGALGAAERRRAERQRAQVLFRLRRYREAAEAFGRLPADDEVRIERARSLARAGEVERAGQELQRIGKRSRGRQAARATLLAALLLEGQGETARARELYASLAKPGSQTPYSIAALWRLGWAAYREGRLEEAIGHFERLGERSADAIAALRARYWRARAAERAGRIGAAEAMASIAREFPLSYYGWRARARGGQGAPAGRSSSPPEIARGESVLAPSELARPQILLEAGLVEEARGELDRLFVRARGLDDRLALAELYADAGDFHRPQQLMVDAYTEPLARGPAPEEIELWWHAWPTPFGEEVRGSAAAGSGLEPELLYAVMREESGYRPEVVSVSGARGLLQLMPATAERMARSVGMVGYSPDDLFLPDVNIRLGSAYLGELLDRFSGRASMAIGAYNAGPRVVARWPGGGPDQDDEWVESIPYDQTRSYVKRVLRSLHAYRVLY